MSGYIGYLIFATFTLVLTLFGGVAIFMLYFWYKSQEHFKKGHEDAKNLVFFRIQVPEDNEVELKAFEQFYTNLLGIKETGKFDKNTSPSISLEIVGDVSGINFYVVAPKQIESLVEKAIHAVYSDAEIQKGSQNAWEIWENGEYQEFKEFYLGKEDYYPIKTFEDIEIDPLNSITSSMSKMSAGEALALQLILRPSSGSWKDAGNATANGLLNKKDKEGNPKTSDKDREKAEVIKNKTKLEGFEGVLRICSVADTQELAKSNLKNLSNAVNTLNNPQGNKFSGKDIKSYPMIPGKKQFMFAFIFRVFPYLHVKIPYLNKTIIKGYSVFSTKELATLFHFPNNKVKTPGINWLRSKSNISPANLPESGLYLGKSEFRGVEKKIYMNTDDRRRHTYVIGQTGTGKSELLKFLAVQDIKAGKGVAFMDPHGSAVKDILKQIPKERIDDVIYFNPGDEDYPMGLNLLDVKSRREQDLVINSFIELLYKLYDPNRQGIVGPQLERAVRNGMLSIMEAVPGGTMVEVMRLVIDQNYQKEITEKVKDPVVKKYWTDEMANTQAFHRSEKTGYFVSKFDRFVTEMVMRNIIGQSKSAFDFGEVMDQKKILLVDLNKGVLGEENSKFLGLLLVPRILGAAFRRANSDKEFDDFYFYVDEFQNFSTPDFVTILSEARKYKLNLIVANQFLSQMTDEIKNAIFGNVGTLISFRVGQDDGKYMAEQFAPTFTENDLINLKVGKTALRLLVDGHPTPPFSLTTDWPAMQEVEQSDDISKQIIELSRKKYAKKAEDVAKEIAKRNESSTPSTPAPGAVRPGMPPRPSFPGGFPQRPTLGTQSAGVSTSPRPFSSGQTPFSQGANQQAQSPFVPRYPNFPRMPSNMSTPPATNRVSPYNTTNRGVASSQNYGQNTQYSKKVGESGAINLEKIDSKKDNQSSNDPNLHQPLNQSTPSQGFAPQFNKANLQQPSGERAKVELKGAVSLADLDKDQPNDLKNKDYKHSSKTFKNIGDKSPPIRKQSSGPSTREGEHNLPKPPKADRRADEKSLD